MLSSEPAGRPLTSAEHFEAELAKVPAELFGMRSALLALYTLLNEYQTESYAWQRCILELADTVETLQRELRHLRSSISELQK